VTGARWQVCIDTGGTFTDCVAVSPAGEVRRAKVLSTAALRGTVTRAAGPRAMDVAQRWCVGDGFVAGFSLQLLGSDHGPLRVVRFLAGPSRLDLDGDLPAGAGPGAAFELRSGLEAPVLAARIATGADPGLDLPPCDMRLATTWGTNALLERRGARVAFFVTRGFGDLLVIGDQQRPDLFALRIEKEPPLHEHVVEVDERMSADGEVVEPLRLEPVESAARRLAGEGVRSAAVALLHAWRNPAHERAVVETLRRAGFEHVSAAAGLWPLIKLLPRAETAVVDACLGPLVGAKLRRSEASLGGGRLHVMTSSGGLVRAAAVHGKDLLLSGPAGGVVGAAAAGRRAGFTKVIGFDMGGTSTDVARIDGRYELAFGHSVGGSRVAGPALAIETVAAGGGSICDWERGGLRVGPRSAGADPGPACYGAGGPLTLTDVNLLLGRLDPERFGIPVSLAAAQEALARLSGKLAGAGEPVPDAGALLEGLIEIADERMADGIAEVSRRRGYDPADYAMVAFGGAGGQHACAVAGHLGIRTIVLPGDASLLSAEGLRSAVVERVVPRQVLRPLAGVGPRLAAWMEELCAKAAAEVAAEGAVGPVRAGRRLVNLRLRGQETTIAVPLVGRLEQAFGRRYRALYGHLPEGEIEVESMSASAWAQPPRPRRRRGVPAAGEPPGAGAAEPRRSRLDGAWRDVPAMDRGAIRPGTPVEGPALVFEQWGACLVRPGWTALADPSGDLVLRRAPPGRAPTAAGRGRGDAVERELFAGRFASIARQMGRVLERTALSTNVKERLDFSCAVLDARGSLVANAPHIPVHLGALGACVRAVRAALDLGPGDVAVTNHPAHGGSHLPDVTLVSPVHHGGTLVGHVASRAHHAEIGGVLPGSMPPRAASLAEEGVVIPPVHLVRRGRARWRAVEALLRRGPWPTRAAATNLADLRAALAANRLGAALLAGLADAHGPAPVAAEMLALEDRAARLAGEALARLPQGRRESACRLDDGAVIRARIEVAGGRPVFDFAGSSGVHPAGLNATPAVVQSAVLYVLRLLAGSLPLNEGLMRAVELRIPPGILNPPFGPDPGTCPAVVGGNVETAQRVVEVLLAALGLCAASQGTMNNVLFGTAAFSYYETVCGGAGAGPGFDGADAVHTHMTNTRITDPEILETRYPVRLERFAVRRGSGGAGAHRGGDGAVREIRFLAPMTLSILSQHRDEGPPGAAGGAPGAPGRQVLRRAGGAEETLGAIDTATVGPGDVLVLETPGGGGWG
jgi:5-oxoprolinase (ATP-hydrolysing)